VIDTTQNPDVVIHSPNQVSTDSSSDDESHTVLTQAKNADQATATTAAPAKTSSASQFMNVIMVPLLTGLVFGSAFAFAKIPEVYLIRGQMIFYTGAMLKMFLAAFVTSAVVFAVYRNVNNGANAERFDQLGAWATTMPYRGYAAASSGSLLVGAGMFISGSCPGTVYGQIGSGSVKAFATWGGAAGGALVYGLLHGVKAIAPSLTKFEKYLSPSPDKCRVDQLVGTSRNTAVAGVTMAAAALVVASEFIWPYQDDVAKMYNHLGITDYNFAFDVPPSLAGVVVGLLQVPLLWFISRTLGCATTYATISANLTFFFNGSDHLNSARKFYWQIFLTAGIVLGAFITYQATSQVYVSDPMLSFGEAALGGVLMGFGARLAGGCTSGHGITGMSYMSLTSIVATCSIFGGAIATALIYVALGIDFY
jgi:uncharacterized membrane protein YedE/YeeE